MKIAVNTRFLLKGKLEGIGWFTFEILKRITEDHPEHEFYFLFDRPFDKSFVFSKNVKPIVLFPPARHPFLWYWWFEISVKNALNKIKPDVFVSTDGYLSLSTQVPTLLVIHDLAFEHYPEYVNKISSAYYKYFTPKFCRKAAHIATVSNYSKQDIIKQYQIDSAKITVTYNGANEKFKPTSEVHKIEVCNQFTKGKKYFVYAGSLHPRKNIARLFAAFEIFKAKTKSEMQLVLAGARGWMLKEIDDTYQAMKYKEEVIFTGHLETDDLIKVIAGSEAMVYVSVFEGFGIPIIEAMNCEVPVITSNITSMPEVAGNAALLVNPLNTQEIADAMIKIADNPFLKNELIAKGNIQKQHFNWNNTAEKIWLLIENVAAKRN